MGVCQMAKAILSALASYFPTEDVIGAMRNLHEVERKINKYQLCVQAALQAPDGNFTAQLQQVTAEGDLDTNDEEDLCPEMRQLQTIVNRPRVSGELTGRTKSTARGQKGTEDTEMVDVDESNLDPLSRAPIKTAVRNRRCRHLYCYTTIVPYIRSITYPRCPIAGCHLPHIREDDLEFTNTN
ncbi:hypothetical protein BIW11_13364 [Tropilaelaps mercedesae]|uniref:SP-RING-type domain-containing protein n=1 Tax=Tropilaelaps mercedesae TaxID=418985 RepID=A0A1V9X2S3_9ACAR|nr:hypothetical protein BIW11_13364 [Tropilaelaps mercedesae]